MRMIKRFVLMVIFMLLAFKIHHPQDACHFGHMLSNSYKYMNQKLVSFV